MGEVRENELELLLCEAQTKLDIAEEVIKAAGLEAIYESHLKRKLAGPDPDLT